MIANLEAFSALANGSLLKLLIRNDTLLQVDLNTVMTLKGGLFCGRVSFDVIQLFAMEQPSLQFASIDVADQAEVMRGFVIECLWPRFFGVR